MNQTIKEFFHRIINFIRLKVLDENDSFIVIDEPNFTFTHNAAALDFMTANIKYDFSKSTIGVIIKPLSANYKGLPKSIFKSSSINYEKVGVFTTYMKSNPFDIESFYAMSRSSISHLCEFLTNNEEAIRMFYLSPEEYHFQNGSNVTKPYHTVVNFPYNNHMDFINREVFQKFTRLQKSEFVDFILLIEETENEDIIMKAYFEKENNLYMELATYVKKADFNYCKILMNFNQEIEKTLESVHIKSALYSGISYAE